MLILGAIVISDIGLVNILSEGNGSRRREHFAEYEYGVPTRATVDLAIRGPASRSG